MSTETIAPTPPATEPVPTLPIVRGPALFNALLKWPEKDRVFLAILLQNSIRENFDSLEQAQANDKVLIRSRLEELLSGKAELLDSEEVFRAMEQRVAEIRRP
jgi:hypothetical protein